MARMAPLGRNARSHHVAVPLTSRRGIPLSRFVMGSGGRYRHAKQPRQSARSNGRQGALGTAGGFSTPAFAAVGAPSLTSPVDGATVTTNPAVSWARVTGAVKYKVRWRVSPTSPSSSSSRARSTPPRLHKNDLVVGTHYWRVMAYDGAGVAGPFSTTRASRRTPPMRRSCVPRAMVRSSSTPPNSCSTRGILWPEPRPTEVGGRRRELCRIPGTLLHHQHATRRSVPPPFNTTFYWHVRGVSAQGVPTQWSEPQSYQMTWAILPPVLTAPPTTPPRRSCHDRGDRARLATGDRRQRV